MLVLKSGLTFYEENKNIQEVKAVCNKRFELRKFQIIMSNLFKKLLQLSNLDLAITLIELLYTISYSAITNTVDNIFHCIRSDGRLVDRYEEKSLRRRFPAKM